MASELFSLYLKLLVLYSPFFVLSCFIGLSRGYTVKERKRLAWKVAAGVLIASLLLYLFGKHIFTLFGITIDAFRIGAGSVLFISALGMAQGKPAVQSDNVQQDVTIVPLTIPLTVGPGTIGALLLMGASQPHWDDKLLENQKPSPFRTARFTGKVVAISLSCGTGTGSRKARSRSFIHAPSVPGL
jgi:multiple antibiotic resistance protein